MYIATTEHTKLSILDSEPMLGTLKVLVTLVGLTTTFGYLVLAAIKKDKETLKKAIALLFSTAALLLLISAIEFVKVIWVT